MRVMAAATARRVTISVSDSVSLQVTQGAAVEYAALNAQWRVGLGGAAWVRPDAQLGGS